MTDEVDPYVKRTTDELDTMWQELAKVEIIAIQSASTSNTMAARLRAYEQKLFRLEGENVDLRALVARLEAQLDTV
jgi:hypothetical protein